MSLSRTLPFTITLTTNDCQLVQRGEEEGEWGEREEGGGGEGRGGGGRGEIPKRTAHLTEFKISVIMPGSGWIGTSFLLETGTSGI
jgi:hypothetical protein